MLGPKSGGIVFVIPAESGTAGVGTGAGIMGGSSTLPRDASGGGPTITCADSTWGIDGDLYEDSKRWMGSCKAFYDTP